MHGFICAKALTLSGVHYEPGETIPAGVILPNRVRALKNKGFIAELTESASVLPGGAQESAPIIIPITKSDGVLEIPAAPKSIVAALCNLQLTAEESAKAIETMTDETALILIHALDSRKTVKAAAQARAEALEGQTGNNVSSEGEEGQGQGDA